MKAFIALAAALSLPAHIRILSLAHAHKVTPGELANTLKQTPAAVTLQLKLLTDAGLVKADPKSPFVKLKRKHLALVVGLLEQFKATAKKDPTLRADAKLAKTLREARQKAEKAAAKAKPKAEKKAKPVAADKKKAAKPEKKSAAKPAKKAAKK